MSKKKIIKNSRNIKFFKIYIYDYTFTTKYGTYFIEIRNSKIYIFKKTIYTYIIFVKL